MKKVLGIAVAVMMLASVVAKAEVSEQSRRMQGVNPSLIGITADEYSDFMSVNTANILDVDGKRLYTQLSNLGNTGNDNALAGGGASDNELLIGGVKPMFDMGNFGGFLWRDKSTVSADIVAISGLASYNAGPGVLTTLAIWGDGEMEYEDIDDSAADRVITEASGESYNKRSDIAIDALAGLDTMIELGDLGVKVGYEKNVTRNISSTFEYSETDEGDGNDYVNADYSSDDIDYNSGITIAPSLRGLSLMGIDLGATLDLGIVKAVDNEEEEGNYAEGSSIHPGTAGEEYSKKYTSSDIEELGGLRIGLKVDGSYPLNDSVNIKGVAGFSTQKLTGDNETEEVDEVTSDAGVAAVINDKVTVSQTIAKENKVSSLMGLIGIDKQVSDELLMGMGLGLSRTASEVISNEERAVSDTDGTKSYTGIGSAGLGNSTDETTSKLTTTNINLPIGLEWTANTWLKARLGASYAVTYSKTEAEVITTVYEDDSAGSAKDSVETTTTVDPYSATDTVSFYSGVGFTVTDNLMVDVTNVSAGANVLDLNSWEISATLKF